MTLTDQEARNLNAFRRSPVSAAIKKLIARRLAEMRNEYVEQAADELQRVRITDTRTIEALLFGQAV